jgi:hypothetical protein
MRLPESVERYNYLQELHHNIFERTEESESASLAELATHASGILGLTVEPTE